jgi:hypothetical protein
MNQDNTIGKWAIVYVMPPNPTGVGKIIDEDRLSVEIKMPWGMETWSKKYIKIFETEKLAQKEYDDYRNNKNNYALEG